MGFMRLLAMAALGLTLAACTANPTPSPSTATTGPGTGPVPTTSAGQLALAVYYTLTQNNGDPQLVREFHRMSVQDVSKAGHIRAAVTEMLTRDAVDPDYRGLWPRGARVANVAASGPVATIDLTSATVNGVGAKAAAIAVQQLVWTVTAVPDVTSVVILLDGRPANELWGHIDISKLLQRGSAVDVLAPVWLISPQHGDTVGRDVTLHIAGIAFEATVNYEIRRGGTLIEEGFITLNAGAPAQGEAKKLVNLDPGSYVITAFLISSNDSSRQNPDDHAITVV